MLSRTISSQPRALDTGEEYTVASLGAIVEVGKERMAECADLPLWEVSAETARLAGAVETEALLQSDYFTFSMRIAICTAIIECEKAKADNWKEQFQARLGSIFPPNLAECLYLKAMVDMRDTVARGGNPTPSKEEWEKHGAETEDILRREADAKRFLSAYKQRPAFRGTPTRLVACPNCGLDKRCDANTKRFRCKCGFDKPYPF